MPDGVYNGHKWCYTVLTIILSYDNFEEYTLFYKNNFISWTTRLKLAKI